MDLRSHVLGIWGYGVGGKALVSFLLSQEIRPLVYDKRTLTEKERSFLEQNGIVTCSSLELFLDSSDCIIPSAGVDIRQYTSVSNKFLTELDFFADFFKKPIIAVTGTLGKTTVTTVLAKMLERAGKRVLVGGNIGVGLCSLIEQQQMADYAVLEVSSFQLEHCCSFAPYIAVWTNFYPNHLDRHASINEYFTAKAQIIKQQSGEMISVVPESLIAQLKEHAQYEHVWVPITTSIPDIFVRYIEQQPGIAFNWQVVVHALVAMGISLEVLLEPLSMSLEHRMEFVRNVNGISFYNDSKATVPEATLAAVNRFCAQPIVLLLGGLSKGVNREPLIAELAGKVKCIVCFGTEAEQLASWCAKNSICHEKATDLAQAVKLGCTHSCPGDILLLSPAGSSFDLFCNYQERGRVFKQIVHAL